MPIAETIAAISCFLSLFSATKTALELPDTYRKFKTNRTITTHTSNVTNIQQNVHDNHQAREYTALLQRNFQSLEKIVHLQVLHMRNEVAVLGETRQLVDSQRGLIDAHRELLAQQWFIIEKAIWILSYLAIALVSVSFLLASREHYFYKVRKWSVPFYDFRETDPIYESAPTNKTTGIPIWKVPQTLLFEPLIRAGKMLRPQDSLIFSIAGDIWAVMVAIISILWPFIGPPFLGIYTMGLILHTCFPEGLGFQGGKVDRCIALLPPALGLGLAYRQLIFGHLDHDVWVSLIWDALVLLGFGIFVIPA